MDYIHPGVTRPSSNHCTVRVQVVSTKWAVDFYSTLRKVDSVYRRAIIGLLNVLGFTLALKYRYKSISRYISTNIVCWGQTLRVVLLRVLGFGCNRFGVEVWRCG